MVVSAGGGGAGVEVGITMLEVEELLGQRSNISLQPPSGTLAHLDAVGTLKTENSTVEPDAPSASVVRVVSTLRIPNPPSAVDVEGREEVVVVV